jgi:hypothetical protein
MLGESILRHPNRDVIDEMFKNGSTSEKVSAWLRQHQRDRRWQTSKVSLQYYRKNFLNMSRAEINKARNEAAALGKHHDVNALTTFTAAEDYIMMKNEQTEVVKKAVDEFTDMKNEVMDAIKLLKDQTVDEQGNPVFIPRHYEILEKLVGRFESVNTSFIKSFSDMEKLEKEKESSSTTININQAQQESEAVKNATKRILLEIDASKVGRYFEILREEMDLYAEKNGIKELGGLKIEIKNKEGNDTNINIVTSLPTAEEEDMEVVDISNENTTEFIVDVDSEDSTDPPQTD